jgi:hypothetical protein
MKVDPGLTTLGFQHLQLTYDKLLRGVASNIMSRQYSKERDVLRKETERKGDVGMLLKEKDAIIKVGRCSLTVSKSRVESAHGFSA